MKKKDFLEMIRSARSALDSILAEFTKEQMDPLAEGREWTAKDVIAHIGWYENEMVNVLRQHTLAGSEWWDFSLQERNTAINAIYRNEDLQFVLENESHSYKTMLELLENLDELDLNDPAVFTGMPLDWQPWSVIASNTYEHYHDHIDQLKELLMK